MLARSRPLLLALAALLLLLLAPAASAAPGERGTYLVQLAEPPVASYRGGTEGIPSTSPRATGSSLRARASAARRYRAHLAGEQRDALERLDGPTPPVTYAYRTAFAGFAAELTEEQAAALREAPEVARVYRDQLLQPSQAVTAPSAEDVQAALGGRTGDTPAYLGLPTGLWQRLGGVDEAGEGVVVGVLDTGIVPEHPSFAADPAGGYEGSPFAPPEVWDGVCQGGEEFSTSACNGKIVGARYFVEGFGADRLDAGAFLSPRDDDGHGSHVAATAAGNYGVDPEISGNDLGVDVISGIAPRAHVAAYKVCWEGEESAGCASSDSVAAIDAAVRDGVDVINFSVGSTTSTVIGPEAIAFLGAADAGVFVANSAGNAGPDASTVGSPASVPWLTTVAASTLARSFEARATVTTARGDTVNVTGASVTEALPSAPLVDAERSGLPGVKPEEAALCGPGTLDPAKVRGSVVLCARGGNDRVDKSRQVELAGGVGMILHNTAANQEIVTDTHWVPTVHVTLEDGLRVKAAIAPGTTVALTAGRVVGKPRGAILAAFSSRGPQTAVADVGKPDVTAPGVNILAAAAPEPANDSLKPGERFQAISGTSMSSPQVAGAGALLTQLHPTLSPAELKSALMTTANPDVLREDGRTRATPFEAGAGEIDPNRAADPGLVLDARRRDYLAYLEGVDADIVTGDVTPLATVDLNLPSIAAGKLVGVLRTARTFRSVEPRSTRWRVEVEGLAGVTATPSVRRFTIRSGATQTVGLTLRVTTAAPDRYVYGALVLTSGERRVRLPVSVRPSRLAAPETVSVEADAPAGARPLRVQTGFAGPLTAVGWGLAAPEVRAGETVGITTGLPVLDPPDAGTRVYPVTVAEGAQLLAARTTGPERTDVDLFLYRGDELVALSAGPDATESIQLPLPPAGEYTLAVVGFSAPTATTTFDLSTWLVADPRPDDLEPRPGLRVTGEPARTTIGGEVDLRLEWAGVDAPGTYLGVVTYGDLGALTIVELTRGGAEPGAAPPAASPPAAGRGGAAGKEGAAR